ncbi:MAG: histidine kinase, partial [Proteobacteria bacterium]|nr:histidine kinase [Pseudomonadota bacterium]
LLDLPPGQQREMIGMRNDGQGFPLEVAVGTWSDDQDQYVSIVGRDVSARREAEDAKQNLETELLHARKLEAVGQLAAGIAHEINTPTQFVGDNTRFLKDAFVDVGQLIAESRRLVDELSVAGSTEQAERLAACLEDADVDFLEEEIPRAIDQSLEGLGRVGKIVSAMKEFAHPGAQGKTAADLNHCIESTITVATNEWKYCCEMELELDPDLPNVFCSAGEINQVVLNMVVNAAHAIEERLGERPTSKGLINISTRSFEDQVEIRIGDTGAGMAPDVVERVFDPFFTTKSVGKGSGQGLSIAHDVIIRKHCGTIRVESEPGVGTTFIIQLPLHADGPCEPEPAGAQDSEGEQP